MNLDDLGKYEVAPPTKEAQTLKGVNERLFLLERAFLDMARGTIAHDKTIKGDIEQRLHRLEEAMARVASIMLVESLQRVREEEGPEAAKEMVKDTLEALRRMKAEHDAAEKAAEKAAG